MKSQPFPYSPVARSWCLIITFAQNFFSFTEFLPSPPRENNHIFWSPYKSYFFCFLAWTPDQCHFFRLVFFLFHSFWEVATTFSTDRLEPCLSVSLWCLLHLSCYPFYSHLVVLCRWSCKKCKHSVRYQIEHLSFSFILMDWQLRTAGQGLH